MTRTHWDLLLFIGDRPEGGRVVYLDTYAGPDAMSRCRLGFYKYSGFLSNLLGDTPMQETKRSGVHQAVWQKRLGLYGEADVHLWMQSREEEDA